MANQIHVLVVDHEESFLRLVRIILEDAGYRTTVCPAGEEAHQAVVDSQPDVVVVDTWLQTRDQGWDLVQTLKLDRSTKDIPVIIATSDAERIKQYSAQVSALRNVLLMPKPFDEATLLRALRQITEPGYQWTSESAALDLPPD